MLRASRNIRRLQQSLSQQLERSDRCRLSTQPSPRCRLSTQPSPKSPVPQAVPKRQQHGGGLFWKLGGTTLVLGVGGIVGYAWYDDEFRTDFERDVLFGRAAMNIIMPYLPARDDVLKRLPWIGEGKVLPASSVSPQTAVEPPFPTPLVKPEVVKQEKYDKTVVAVPAPDVTTPEPVVDEQATAETRRREMEEAQNAALEMAVHNGLLDSRVAVETAKERLADAADSVAAHTAALRQAMDDSAEDGKGDADWVAMTTAYEKKIAAVAAAESTVEKTEAVLENMRTVLKEGRVNSVTKRNPVISQSEQEVNKLTYHFSVAEGELSKAQSECRVIAEYSELVKKGRAQFKKELESFQPDVRIGNRLTGKMSEEELNWLIAHAHRRIAQMQRHLAAQEAESRRTVESALAAQRCEDDALTAEAVERERRRLTDEFGTARAEWESESRVDFERELRLQLVRQAAAHSDHLAAVLQRNEAEVQQRYAEQLRVGVLEARGAARRDVVGAVARLHGIEAALDERADAERDGRRAQELWVATQAFRAHIDDVPDADDDAGGAAAAWEDRLRPLAGDVSAIAAAAGAGDPLVSAVLRSLPAEVAARGVWPERALADRFTRVRRVARRVALVDDPSRASLLRYLASYVQAAFVVTDGGGDDADETVPRDASTFWLLDRAERCMTRGDVALAVRYASQLTGEARRVAADWIAEARLHLEAKQAADALLGRALAAAITALD